MALLGLTVNLLVADVNETARYWTEVLGFELTLGVLEGTEETVFGPTESRLGFAILKRDDVEIMLQSHDSVGAELAGFRASQGGDAVSLYIDVDDVNVLWEELHDEVDVVVELRETFYGAREFAFRDPNGYLIGFAQRLQQEH